MELLQHEIYWIRHCSYPAETELTKHQHFFFHYLYIVDGKGKMVIDKKMGRWYNDTPYCDIMPTYGQSSQHGHFTTGYGRCQVGS